MTEKESDILAELHKIRMRVSDLLVFIEDTISYLTDTEHTLPWTHKSPPAEVEKMIHYQTEVLNKCEGKPSGSIHTHKSILAVIAKQVPRHIIEQALASMQDKRQQNLNPDSKYTNNLFAYYKATIKGKCKDVNLSIAID